MMNRMKKYIFLLLVQLLSLTGLGQDTLSQRFLFNGAFVSPDCSYRWLASGTDPLSGIIIQGRNGSERPVMGFTVGYSGMRMISRNTALEYGFGYTEKGYATEKIAFTVLDSPETPEGSIRYRISYLEIPLVLHYIFPGNKRNCYLSAGASGDIFLAQRSHKKFEYHDGAVRRTTEFTFRGYGLIRPSIHIHGGIEMKLYKHWVMRVGPAFRFSPVNVTTNNLLWNMRLWNAGVRLGLYKKTKLPPKDTLLEKYR